MAIEFECTCGKRLSVPDDAAGRKAKCPSCQAVVDVPGEATAEEPPGDERLSKVDRFVDKLGEDLAESKERAPQLTQVAIGLAVVSGATLLVTLFIYLFSSSLVLWVLVWLPMSAVGLLTALGMIKGDHRTPKLVKVAVPAVAGAAWAILWLSAMPADPKNAAPLTTLIALANVAAFAFLYWYFSRPWMELFFQENLEMAEVQGESPKPAEGVEKK